jgi:hypothetical protein
MEKWISTEDSEDGEESPTEEVETDEAE